MPRGSRRAFFYIYFIYTMINFIKEHKQHLPAVALVFGLVWDSLTLGRPDELYGNLVLLSYLFIAGFCIVLMTRREMLKKEPKLWLSLIIQFSFGNLTGGLLVLYIGSATFIGNWPFLLILIGLLIGNELFKTRYKRLRFNTVVYYLLVLLYSILIIPVLFRSIAPWTFLASVLLSIFVISGFMYILKLIAKDVFTQSKKTLRVSIFSILVIFGTLYYSNLIPPVPLSVRDIGIFHSVERVGGNYLVTYETKEWYRLWHKFLKRSDSTIYLVDSSTASCFSAVFAPTELETPVFHVWEKFNEDREVWDEKGRFNFSISGGRIAGYRGYSEKTVDEGRWRCSVKTERGALLGRAGVTVSPGKSSGFITSVR